VSTAPVNRYEATIIQANQVESTGFYRGYTADWELIEMTQVE
jgi:hypothetical protein